MRDQYAGNVSDVLKFAFLRALAGADRALGIAWYYAPGDDVFAFLPGYFTGAKKRNANLPHQITSQLFDFVGRLIVLRLFCTLIDNAPKEATPILATSSKTASAR